LFAVVVSAMEKEAASWDGGADATVTSTIVFVAADLEQKFDGPKEFVAEHPPDHLGRFQRLAAGTSAGGGEIVFELKRRQGKLSSGGEALLRVTAHDDEAARQTMAELLPVASSGYQAFWGPCSIPPGVTSGPEGGPPLHLVRTVLNTGIAVILGAALYMATAAFGVPALAVGALLIGLAVPTVVDRIVPEIEIASGGRTRFRAISGRLGFAAFSSFGAWIVGLFAG
jgi:hypothetical protein